MNLVANIDLLYSASGFVVGALVGVTGVGGGALMTPMLVLLFGVHPATAIGTDLLYASATKGVGTLVHGFFGSVEWSIVRRLASGSVPSAALTMLLLHYLGAADGRISTLLTHILGLVLILSAVTLAFRKQIVALAQTRLGHTSPRQVRDRTVLAGAVLGFLVTVSSVGAGAIGVTILLLLYPRLPIARIVGSDIAHAVPLTLLAGSGHWLMGSVDFVLLASLLCGSIPGVIIGSRISTRISESLLRSVLAGVLTVVGGRLII